MTEQTYFSSPILYNDLYFHIIEIYIDICEKFKDIHNLKLSCKKFLNICNKLDCYHRIFFNSISEYDKIYSRFFNKIRILNLTNSTLFYRNHKLENNDKILIIIHNYEYYSKIKKKILNLQKIFRTFLSINNNFITINHINHRSMMRGINYEQQVLSNFDNQYLLKIAYGKEPSTEGLTDLFFTYEDIENLVKYNKFMLKYREENGLNHDVYGLSFTIEQIKFLSKKYFKFKENQIDYVKKKYNF